MKVLLCTPYKKASNVNWGGISVWANNILSFAKEREDIDQVLLIPVSYDRYHRVPSGKNIVLRFWYGYQDVRRSLKNTKITIKRTNPDVIHICSSASLGILRDLLLLSIARRNNIRFIVHFHFGLIPELQQNNGIEWKLIKYLVNHADNTIVMTKDSFEVLKKEDYKNVSLVPNPISSSFISLISHFSPVIERIPGRIVYVGHVVPNKGVREIVESCRSISGLDIRFVGETPSMSFVESLKSLIDSNTNGTTLTFVGQVSQEEIIKELLSAELFVFPSYYEGFPNAILEAMACGCPIIASNVGAIPEMLAMDDSPCGVCVPPHDTYALTKAIESLLMDSVTRNALASKAKERVETEYSISKVWDNLVKVWDS